MRILLPDYATLLHYGTAGNSWIKLRRTILRDSAFMLLPPEAKLLLIGLWLLALENQPDEGFGVVEMTKAELEFNLPTLDVGSLSVLSTAGHIRIEEKEAATG